MRKQLLLCASMLFCGFSQADQGSYTCASFLPSSWFTGAQGPKGDKGDTGERGPRGSRGAPGVSFTSAYGVASLTLDNETSIIGCEPIPFAKPSDESLYNMGWDDSTRHFLIQVPGTYEVTYFVRCWINEDTDPVQLQTSIVRAGTTPSSASFVSSFYPTTVTDRSACETSRTLLFKLHAGDSIHLEIKGIDSDIPLLWPKDGVASSLLLKRISD